MRARGWLSGSLETVSSISCRQEVKTIELVLEGYLLLGLISSLVFRAVRDALPNDPIAQEKIVGASLLALALADVRILLSPPATF